jgi:hypothetical protein
MAMVQERAAESLEESMLRDDRLHTIERGGSEEENSAFFLLYALDVRLCLGTVPP